MELRRRPEVEASSSEGPFWSAEEPEPVESDRLDQSPEMEAPADQSHPVESDMAVTADSADDRTCRICFDGEEVDDNPLISPCRCKGSMKFVHRQCLQQWRQSSSNPKSFFECDQCHFKYHFRRTQAAFWLSHWLVKHVVTFLVFCVLVFVSGFVSKILEYLLIDDVPVLMYWDSVWSVANLAHWVYGLFGVGAIGSLSLFGGFGVRGGFFIGGGGGTRDKTCSIILVVLVAVGLVKAFISLYGFIEDYSTRMLDKAGHMVENVQEAEAAS